MRCEEVAASDGARVDDDSECVLESGGKLSWHERGRSPASGFFDAGASPRGVAWNSCRTGFAKGRGVRARSPARHVHAARIGAERCGREFGERTSWRSRSLSRPLHVRQARRFRVPWPRVCPLVHHNVHARDVSSDSCSDACDGAASAAELANLKNATSAVAHCEQARAIEWPLCKAVKLDDEIICNID